MDEERDPGELTSLSKFQPMPDLDPDEYRGLLGNIKENGVEVPVVIDEEGNVIDGHHRVRACKELGIEVPVIVQEGRSEDEKIALAWELNMERRHLEDTEKQDLIEQRLIELDERGVSKTNASVSEELGVDPSWVGKVRKRLVEDGKIGSGPDISNLPQQEKREAIQAHEEKHPNKSARGIAEDLGVSHPTVRSVQKRGKRTEVRKTREMQGDRIFQFRGSKASIANWLVSKIPEHTTYVEPFAGSAAIHLNKPPSDHEVLNDIREPVANFFEVLRDKPGELERELADIELTKQQHETWTVHWDEEWRPEDEVKRAAVRFFRPFSQWRPKAQTGGFAYPDSKPENAENFRKKKAQLTEYAKRYHRSDVDYFIDRFDLTQEHFAGELDPVEIENRDFEEVLREYDSPEALFYVDPPYVDFEDDYEGSEDEEGNFTPDDHDRLVDALTELEGEFILSYGDEVPPGLEEYRAVKMERPDQKEDEGEVAIEHHIMSYPEEDEGTFTPGNTGDALRADW